MGFSVIIASAIILSAFFSMMSIIIPTTINSMESTHAAIQTSSDLLNEQLHTYMTINSINAVNNSTSITIHLSNNGTTKLWQYDKFNVIISYDANMSSTKQRIVEPLTYHNSCSTLSFNSWCIYKIFNDYSDIGIVNPGESFQINGLLQDVPYKNGIMTISVSSDNGAGQSKSVVVP